MEDISRLFPFYTLKTFRQRIGWIINLRWVAIFGILTAIPIGKYLFTFNIPYDRITFLATLLILFNLVYFFIYKYFSFKSFLQEVVFTEAQILVDFILISFMVHYSGGIENPFYFLYIVHIIISGVLFQGVVPFVNTVFASLLLTVWTVLEYSGKVPLYSLNHSRFGFSHVLISLIAFYVLAFASTVVIVDFINRYRKLKAIIDEKSKLLEMTINERDRIFRFTAHELKSPITTLKSTLSVLNSIYADKIDEETRNLLRRAEQRADQILDMVKDMIEITRYRRTEEEVVKLEKVDFCKWLDDILESQKVFAKSKGVEFEIGPVSCAMVVIDTNSLSKIAINLVNNAVRYTPTGGKVTVTPFVRQREYGIIVSDTGIGIAEDEIDKVFEEFYRAKNAKEVERLGTGLGLSLVKQIVERLGGDIKVESRLGEGSKFTVTLPFSS
ncbi:MAG: hypothetical protein DRP91_00570 [Candidatus Neomarinimicrobiota bacterium]|nr:MAG: hypothetical protein DRP91_00570 [Candidatus Neomarinimicrobiota bacterium]